MFRGFCCCCFFPFPAISELYITVQVLPHKHNTHNSVSLMFKYYQCSYPVQCFFPILEIWRKKERKMSLLLVKCFLSLVFLSMTLLSICYQLTVHSYIKKKERKTNLPGSLVYEFLPFLFYATLKNLRQLNMSHWALKNSDWWFSYIWTSVRKKKLVCWDILSCSSVC